MRWRLWGVTAGLLVVLAGCGATSAVKTTPAQATPGSAALNGCLVQTSGAATTPADTTLSDGSGGQFQTVTVTVGQTIEVRLRADIRWTMAPLSPAGAMTIQSPQSVYDVATRQCVWRFTATTTGAVDLDFTGGLVCAPTAACPAIAAIQRFTVTIKGSL